MSSLTGYRSESGCTCGDCPVHGGLCDTWYHPNKDGKTQSVCVTQKNDTDACSSDRLKCGLPRKHKEKLHK